MATSVGVIIPEATTAVIDTKPAVEATKPIFENPVADPVQVPTQPDPVTPAVASANTAAQELLRVSTADLDPGTGGAADPPYTFREPIDPPPVVPPALAGAVTPEGALDLNAVDPFHVQQMSPQERQDFFNYLAGQGVTVDFEENGWPSYGNGSAADFLIANLHAQDPTGKTLAHIYATNPNLVLPRGNHPEDEAMIESLVNNSSTILEQMMELDPGPSLSNTSQAALGTLTSEYMRIHPNDPGAFDRVAASLIQGIDDAGLGNRAIGQVIGSLAAGLANSGRTDQIDTGYLAGLLTDGLGMAAFKSKAVPAAIKGILRTLGAWGSGALPTPKSPAEQANQFLAEVYAGWDYALDEAGMITASDRAALSEGVERALAANGLAVTP